MVTWTSPGAQVRRQVGHLGLRDMFMKRSISRWHLAWIACAQGYMATSQPRMSLRHTAHSCIAPLRRCASAAFCKNCSFAVASRSSASTSTSWIASMLRFSATSCSLRR